MDSLKTIQIMGEYSRFKSLFKQLHHSKKVKEDDLQKLFVSDGLDPKNRRVGFLGSEVVQKKVGEIGR